MRFAITGTGFINKVLTHAEYDLGLEIVAVVNHNAGSTAKFGKRFGISHQYETMEERRKDLVSHSLV